MRVLAILFFAVLACGSGSLVAPWWTKIKSKVTIEELDVGNFLICLADNTFKLRSQVIYFKPLLWVAKDCFKTNGIIQEEFGNNLKTSQLRRIYMI